MTQLGLDKHHSCLEVEFLDEILTKVLRVSSLLFTVTSTFYSFALRNFISSNSRNLFQFLQFSYCTVYTVKEKGGKPDRKPYPLPYGLRNPYINLKSENSHAPRNLNEIVLS
jgi:hypothetical protein